MRFYKQIFFLLFLVICIFQRAFSQIKDSVDFSQWESINAEESREQLKELEGYFSHSFQWEEKEKLALWKKLYHASTSLKVDSLISFYGEKLGTLYKEADSLSIALNILNNALANSYDNTSKRTTLNSIGGLYFKSNDYDTALEYYFKSLDVAKKLNDGSEAYPLGNISQVYFAIGEYENAIKYLKYSIGFSKNLPSIEREYSLVYDYAYLIDCYSISKQSDSVEFYINQINANINTIDTFPGQKYKDAQFVGYLSIADYYLNFKNATLAKSYIEKIKAVANSYYQPTVLLFESRYFILIKDYDRALEILEKEVLSNDEYNIIQLLELKEICYTNFGEFQKAYDTNKQLSEMRLEQFEEDKIKYITFADVKYESLQKNEVILSLKQDQEIKLLKIRNQQYIVAIAITLLLLLTSGIFYFWKRLQNKKKEEQQKDKLFSNIAHEFQTPLSIIQGLGKQIYKSDRLTDSDHKALDIIIRNSNHLSDATNQILALNLPSSKQLSSTFVLFRLTELLEYILREYEFLVKKKEITIHSINGKDTPIYIYSDVSKVSTILKNLISNAVKHTPENGVITIDYSNDNTAYHEISIKDNGSGIAQKDLPFLFDRYFQSKDTNHKAGFGLGLAICKEYIEALNGDIKINSTPDIGSIFTLKIPTANEASLTKNGNLYQFPKCDYSKQIPVLTQEKPVATSKDNHILIVEDTLDFCSYLEQILKNDYHLHFVHNGNDALDFLEKNTPSLIITDWMMQGMDGLAFVKKIKSSEQLLSIPILMLTARSLASDKIKALRIGIDDYLIKPTEENVLKSRIANLINNLEEKRDYNYINTIVTQENVKMSPSDQDWLFQIEQIISSVIHDFDLNLEQLAQLSSINIKQLNRKIKLLTGLTTKKYIQEIRYWEARRMLETKEYDSVKAVCLSVGFKDQKNFSRKFKARFGVYPSSYLK